MTDDAALIRALEELAYDVWGLAVGVTVEWHGERLEMSLDGMGVVSELDCTPEDYDELGLEQVAADLVEIAGDLRSALVAALIARLEREQLESMASTVRGSLAEVLSAEAVAGLHFAVEEHAPLSHHGEMPEESGEEVAVRLVVSDEDGVLGAAILDLHLDDEPLYSNLDGLLEGICATLTEREDE